MWLAFVQVMKAVATQLREVGIERELDESDLVAVVQPKARERRANWYLSAWTSASARAVHVGQLPARTRLSTDERVGFHLNRCPHRVCYSLVVRGQYRRYGPHQPRS
jgi:hypothetical protein